MFLPILAILALATVCAVPAGATVLPVSENAKLQEVVDTATYGDTVLVAPGAYRRVELRSGVKIIAKEGSKKTLLKNSGFYVVQGEGVDSLASIEGFTIDGVKGAEGVVFAKESKYLVRDCVIQSGWSGVRTLYSELRIEGCTIRDCQNGIYLFESKGVVSENDIQLCYTALMIISSQPRILRNTITRNGLGFYVQKHSDPVIGGTLATANRVWNNPAGAVRNDSYVKEQGVRTWRPMILKVPFNFWGGDCPDSTKLFRGTVMWRPWVDESGKRSVQTCPGGGGKR